MIATEQIRIGLMRKDGRNAEAGFLVFCFQDSCAGGMGYMFVFIGRIARLCDPCRGVKLHCFKTSVQQLQLAILSHNYIIYYIAVHCITLHYITSRFFFSLGTVIRLSTTWPHQNDS